MADLWDQTINLTTPDNVVQPIALGKIDSNRAVMVTKCAAYGVEVGASLVMLAVILTMTPKTKFWRFPTYLNIAALCNNVVRLVLLISYFNSSWVTFYALYSGDYSNVTRTDYANSAASSIVTIPLNIMIMWALILQAWAMIRFWPQAYKWAIFLWSVVLVLLEIGFIAATAAYQVMQLSMSAEAGYDLLMDKAWVRYCFLGFEVACICWFCFLFICKLATHLWRNRSFLPATKGLGAMDALVMTNGVLMLIPVFFAILQCKWSVWFEPGSLLYTSVIIVLPLGTLVAQRIADPAAFNSEVSATERGDNHHHPQSPFEAGTSDKSTLLNPTWSQSSKNSIIFPGTRKSSVKSDVKRAGVTAHISSLGRYQNSQGGPITPEDIELARIDAEIEPGQVRVDREIQRAEEVL